MVGTVRAWKIVTISIAVSLSVTYTKNQTIGHGYISIKVRICKFVKKEFKKNFKKRLSGSGGNAGGGGQGAAPLGITADLPAAGTPELLVANVETRDNGEENEAKDRLKPILAGLTPKAEAQKYLECIL